ncbi:CDGSH iron-sulfur domain-containing protein [Streptomyces heilongjiangensis]|nr:CDGSH iron-sulfur domain-containing protein [Streptomyces heilongjiangensis]MDC2947129.1 CDGSH iron-sulfur domain-containing protein [Streptomyces heilongjiangensis]
MTVRRSGPLLVEGPVEVTAEDGTTVTSDRFRVALCTCRRSRIHPWCDTSHRQRSGGGSDTDRGRRTPDTPRAGPPGSPRDSPPGSPRGSPPDSRPDPR